MFNLNQSQISPKDYCRQWSIVRSVKNVYQIQMIYKVILTPALYKQNFSLQNKLLKQKFVISKLYGKHFIIDQCHMRCCFIISTGFTKTKNLCFIREDDLNDFIS